MALLELVEEGAVAWWECSRGVGVVWLRSDGTGVERGSGVVEVWLRYCCVLVGMW